MEGIAGRYPSGAIPGIHMVPLTGRDHESLWNRLGRLWCTWTHPPPMWPIHSVYRCPRCMRTHHVPWANSGRPAAAGNDRGNVGAFDPVSPAWRA
jgi:hypothetical protein